MAQRDGISVEATADVIEPGGNTSVILYGSYDLRWLNTMYMSYSQSSLHTLMDIGSLLTTNVGNTLNYERYSYVHC